MHTRNILTSQHTTRMSLIVKPGVGHTLYSWIQSCDREQVPVGHTSFSWGNSSRVNRSKANRSNKLGTIVKKHKQRRTAALQCFLAAIEADVTFSLAHYNLGSLLAELGANDAALHHLEISLKASQHTKDCQMDMVIHALCNISALHMRQGNYKLALEYTSPFMRHHFQVETAPPCATQSLNWNRGSAFRLLNRQSEGLQWAWSEIPAHVRHSFNQDMYQCKDSINIPNYCVQHDMVAIVLVKWGTKYGSEYVNKLAQSLKSHCQGTSFKIYCYTDDEDGIDSGIVIRKLDRDETFKGWWSKAFVLFSENGIYKEFDHMHEQTNLPSGVVYIDLDTVIVGNVSQLWDCALRELETHSEEYEFAILDTDGMDNEGYRNGFNSSVMLLPTRTIFSKLLSPIYTTLTKYSNEIFNVIHRLDHWIEMTTLTLPMIETLKPVYLQTLLSNGFMAEFRHDIEKSTHFRNSTVPQGVRLVNFPLKPKPHELSESEWMQHFWGGGTTKLS